MKNLLFNGLIICVLIVPSLEQLFFNFRTQYDGYIYPKWKPKVNKNSYFYEDAVVVGNNFIVLADGLGGEEGPSGVYSIYQCLNVAQMLSNSAATTAKKLYEDVKQTAIDATKSLNLPNDTSMSKVATTLVYVKLEGNKLLAGVIGDSALLVFRLDPDARIMKLIFQSKESVRGFNSPYHISPVRVDPANEYEIDIQEGDIVMALSDGVIDVLPISFIVAALNFLINRMIEKVTIEKKSLDSFDHDYDLGNFVESYLQNLHEVSNKLKNTISNNIKEINNHDVDIFQDEDPNNQIEKNNVVLNENKPNLKPQNTESLKQKSITNLNQSSNDSKNNAVQQKKTEQKIHQKAQSLALPPNKNQQQQQIQQQQQLVQQKLQVQEQLVQEQLIEQQHQKNMRKLKIKLSMIDIFGKEVCNTFDPTYTSSIFKSYVKSTVFRNLMNHNLEPRNKGYLGVDCFRNDKINKTATLYENPTEWNCDHILDLTSPIHPIFDDDKKFKYHNLHKCVIDATPKLPQGIQPKDIPNYFNPRFVHNNILSGKEYIRTDLRLKLDIFFLKKHYKKDLNRVVFPEDSNQYPDNEFITKDDDSSIATAAISSKDIFHQTEIDPEKNFYKPLEDHIKETRTWYINPAYIVI